MALDQEYLKSLGLEIARKKYYNAAKVETVIDDFRRRSTQLLDENAALHERLDALSYGREEIGDAILSAKTIAQHLLAEAQEKSERLLAEAQEKAERLLAEAQEKAERLSAEDEERRRAAREDCAAREQEAVERVRNWYVRQREQHLEAVRLLDEDWQRFLCSLGESDAPKADALPDDLSEKLGAIAADLDAIENDAPDDE